MALLLFEAVRQSSGECSGAVDVLDSCHCDEGRRGVDLDAAAHGVFGKLIEIRDEERFVDDGTGC